MKSFVAMATIVLLLALQAVDADICTGSNCIPDQAPHPCATGDGPDCIYVPWKKLRGEGSEEGVKSSRGG